MTQTEMALSIAADQLAVRDTSRTAAQWLTWLMDEAAKEAKRVNDKMLDGLATKRQR